MTARQALTPTYVTVLNHLTKIVVEISSNPSNPKFNHFTFEAISALIRYVSPLLSVESRTDVGGRIDSSRLGIHRLYPRSNQPSSHPSRRSSHLPTLPNSIPSSFNSFPKRSNCTLPFPLLTPLSFLLFSLPHCGNRGGTFLPS